MKRITATAAALAIAVLVLFTQNIKAQDFNPLEKTYLTFSGPVELPGMTLPAGTYTFKLADTPSRNVVQVMSRDEKTIHGQFLFVQSFRPQVTSDPVVMFRETAEGTTPAIQYWYYPGESIGKEFVYPKDQAAKIASRTHSTVLASEGESASTINRIDESGNVKPLEPTAAEPQSREASAATVESRAQVVAPAPAARAPEPPAPAQSANQAVGNQAPSNQTAAAELPRTASPVPMTGLIGVLALAMAFGLRAFRG